MLALHAGQNPPEKMKLTLLELIAIKDPPQSAHDRRLVLSLMKKPTLGQDGFKMTEE